jgi:hypothetical protein
LDGLGKYYFPDGVQYVGRFRNGIFQGLGCLQNVDKTWRAGRWNGTDLVVPDEGSGKGSGKKWIIRYLGEMHKKSKKYFD